MEPSVIAQAETPPAGGGETGQIIIGTVGGAILTAAMFWLVLAHRSGRTQLLNRAGALAERQTGLPGWCAVPLTVLSTSLIVAVFGMYWDIATHIDSGRDEGPFANASHYFILVGLFGIFAAGLIAIFMPTSRPSRSAVPLPTGWDAPLGGVLILLCAIISLSAFPLDDIWHRIFGQDVTLYGPTHLLLFGGAALSVVGGLALMTEGLRAREAQALAAGQDGAAPQADGDDPAKEGAEAEAPEHEHSGMRRLLMAGFAGAFLIALSTFQGEYDFAVPQFKLVLHPVLLMIAASVALVAARIYVGRGGALAAALFFIVIRGALSLLVSPTFGHTGLHFPLYLVEAAVVELVALRVDPRRAVRFGLAAGAGIGTIGLAAEWAWSYVWWTIEWPASLLPEAVIAGFVAAVAGGVLGALIGNGVSPEGPAERTSWVPGALAAAALIGVLAYAVPISDGDQLRASVELTEVDGYDGRTVHATATLDPSEGADDAHWFVSTAWQGQEGRSVVDPLEEVRPGVWRTTKPVPVYGTWKASLRLHKGDAVQGLPLYFPEDPAIPAEAIPARASFEREFVRDIELLQREQKDDVSPVLKPIAYLVVLLIAILLVAALTAGVMRLSSVGSPKSRSRFTREGPPTTPATRPTQSTGA
jgi:hypothetical protein